MSMPSQSMRSQKYVATLAQNWPAAVIGLGGFLTIIWVAVLVWLLLHMLLQLF